MRFSLITSTPTEMYAFNPFINTPAVAPLTMEAFVAPADFNPDAQELNIVKAFAAYPDVNKKYIFSVGTSATTVLPAVTGRSYAYAENEGAYTTIASGTVTWTVGSTKRNVIVVDVNVNLNISILSGTVWFHGSEFIYKIQGAYNTYLKYITFTQCNITQLGQLNSCNLTGSITAKKLTYIEGGALSYNASLTSVDFTGSTITTIPWNGVTGYGCFQNCTALTSVILNPEVWKAESYCFSGCSNLVTITGSLTWIGNYCFFNNYKLTAIPNSLNISRIGNSAFRNCTMLTNINIGTSLTYVGGDLFEGTTSVKINNDNTLYLPNLTTIGGGAFAYSKIKSVDFTGSTITTIPLSGGTGYGCFQNCTALTSVTLSATITTTQDYSFMNCSSLITVYNSSLSTCGKNSFRNCSNLMSINISNCTYFGQYAFFNCSSLASVTLISSITNIGANVFEGCTALHFNNDNVVFLTSLTYLGGCAFYNTQLKYIDLTGSSITEFQIDGDRGEATFNRAQNLRSAVLNSGLQYLKNSSFYQCNLLEFIDLPSSVNRIGSNCFSSCPNIAYYNIRAVTAPLVDNVGNAFANTSPKPLHVPVGATGYNVAPWTDTTMFSSIIYDL